MASVPLTHLAAIILCALALGGMVFFAGVFAPLVVRRLPAEAANALISDITPHYCTVLVLLCGASAALLWNRPEAPVLAAVAGLFAFSRFALMPRLDKARRASVVGDPEETEMFSSLHSLSTLVHFAQMAALIAVFLRLLLVSTD
jgi:hypothetical protein